MPATGGRRAGFAAVLGWTNVGKSTLLNRLLGQNLVLTSPRAQTTRQSIHVVVSEPRGQIVFVDTPGFHQPKHLLNQLMLREAEAALQHCDLALHVVAPDVRREDDSLRVALSRYRGPRVLVVNKIDLLGREKLIPFLHRYSRDDFYREIVPVSATSGENCPALLDVCFGMLPEGRLLYDEEQVSDRTERFFMAEIIRGHAIRHTHQEVPTAVAVVVESSKWQEDRELWDIQATIYVERDSQKGILIGAGGSMLKTIGTGARLELESFLQGKVFLQLWVKVRRDWTSDRRFIDELLGRP